MYRFKTTIMNNLSDYKTVLIVGNGFDRNIGMKTSYSEFMESQIFKDVVSKGENTLLKYLAYKNHNSKKWVDIEIELGNYANILHSKAEIYSLLQSISCTKTPSVIQKEFKTDYLKLCNTLKNYLNIIHSTEPNKEIVESSIAYELLKEIQFDGIPFYVINFNYTLFVEYLIDTTIGARIDTFIRYIHGSLIDESDIVFGVQDSFNLDREHVYLYKSHSKYKDVMGLPQILENANKIIFFGYSLGETDHSYFDDFFKAQTQPNCKGKEFVFYHYGQSAYDDIIWQLKTLTNNRTSYLNQYNSVQFKDSSIVLK